MVLKSEAAWPVSPFRLAGTLLCRQHVERIYLCGLPRRKVTRGERDEQDEDPRHNHQHHTPHDESEEVD